MKLYSTNKKTPPASLKEAVLKGLAEDKGLYMPNKIPVLPKRFFDTISGRSFSDISNEVAQCILQDGLPPAVIKAIVEDAINFDAPLITLHEDIHVLELFHGPTMAFKDFGARFMSRVMKHFMEGAGRKLTILVATSGDTGSAVANGFLNVPGTEVFILYPQGGVSKVQEQQLTTLGNNITALEIQGTFDDCQHLVKEAFLDKDLNAKMLMTSANSINIARLVPQSFYYFYAYAQLRDKNKPLVFSVPSGNFGNLTAALIAKAMGLPVDKIVAATNSNDIVPVYLEKGIFEPRPSKMTISNAMDVGNPSNFARMNELYLGQLSLMQKEIAGFAFSDEQTREAMGEVFQKYGYIIDPHGAVAYLGLDAYKKTRKAPVNGILLETAHPAKFHDVVEKVLNREIPIPERLALLLHKTKKSIVLEKEFAGLKEFLLNR